MTLGMRIDGDARAMRGVRRDGEAALVVVLESSLAELVIDGAAHRLDRANLALVPAGASYRLSSRSPAARVLTLRFAGPVLAGAIREYAPHVEAKTFAVVLGALRILPRTRWFDELVHRYVFERVVCEKHTSAAARFLETEMAKELYFVGLSPGVLDGRSAPDRRGSALPDKPIDKARRGPPRRDATTRSSVVHEEDVLARRAREYIEDHLFEALRVADLARHCHASESSLLRAFRRELGVAPIDYIRARRLDEARLLLRAGRYTVGEVATRVGYATVAAFTTAFRRRFEELPSAIARAAR